MLIKLMGLTLSTDHLYSQIKARKVSRVQFYLQRNHSCIIILVSRTSLVTIYVRSIGSL